MPGADAILSPNAESVGGKTRLYATPRFCRVGDGPWQPITDAVTVLHDDSTTSFLVTCGKEWIKFCPVSGWLWWGQWAGKLDTSREDGGIINAKGHFGHVVKADKLDAKVRYDVTHSEGVEFLPGKGWRFTAIADADVGLSLDDWHRQFGAGKVSLTDRAAEIDLTEHLATLSAKAPLAEQTVNLDPTVIHPVGNYDGSGRIEYFELLGYDQYDDVTPTIKGDNDAGSYTRAYLLFILSSLWGGGLATASDYAEGTLALTLSFATAQTTMAGRVALPWSPNAETAWGQIGTATAGSNDPVDWIAGDPAEITVGVMFTNEATVSIQREITDATLTMTLRTPSAPRNLAATVQPDGTSVLVTWDAPETAATTTIYVYSSGNVVNALAYEPQVLIENLVPGEEQIFAVEALAFNGSSYGPHGPAAQIAVLISQSGGAHILGNGIIGR